MVRNKPLGVPASVRLVYRNWLVTCPLSMLSHYLNQWWLPSSRTIYLSSSAVQLSCETVLSQAPAGWLHVCILLGKCKCWMQYGNFIYSILMPKAYHQYGHTNGDQGPLSLTAILMQIHFDGNIKVIHNPVCKEMITPNSHIRHSRAGRALLRWRKECGRLWVQLASAVQAPIHSVAYMYIDSY